MNWSDIPRHPSRKTLRQFGMICFIVFGVLGAWRSWNGDHHWPTYLLMGLGLAGGLLGLVAPQWLGPPMVGWMIVVFPIGWVVSRIVLTFVYLLVFAPIGFLLRLRGFDPLALCQPKADSFWTRKSQPADQRRYMKQY